MDIKTALNWYANFPDQNINNYQSQCRIYLDEYKESMKSKYEEYLLCKDRGHKESGLVLTSYPPWNVCKYCGTAYRDEEELNAPINGDFK